MSNSAYSHAEVYSAGAARSGGSSRTTAPRSRDSGRCPPRRPSRWLPRANETAGVGYTPDGSEYQGSYGGASLTGARVNYSLSALAVAEAGSYTSGPSARAVIAGTGT